jgi:AcrR family transcriptional regulator
MVELCATEGFEGVTVRGLSRLAGVSTKTFYDCFANVEECFGAAQGSILRDIQKRVSEVDSDAEGQLRAGVTSAFAFLGENPQAARFMLLRSVAADPMINGRARGAGVTFERLLAGDETAGPRAAPVPPQASHAFLGAALRMLREPLLDGRPEEVHDRADPFVGWLLAVRDERLARVWTIDGRYRPLSVAKALPAPAIRLDHHFLLAAALKLAAIDGYKSLTVPAIRREAGVPRRSFDRHFEGVEDCFLAAAESLLTRVWEWAVREAGLEATWEGRVVRILDLLAVQLARDPILARLASAEILAPGLPGLRCREDIVTRWAERLRRAAPRTARPSSLAAEASVAAVWRIVAREAGGGRAEGIRNLVPGMAFLVLAPAVGPAAAEQAIAAEFR